MPRTAQGKTTIKVSRATRDRLAAAKADDMTMDDAVNAAVDALEEAAFWAEAEAFRARLDTDPELRAAHDGALAEWDRAIAQRLSE